MSRAKLNNDVSEVRPRERPTGPHPVKPSTEWKEQFAEHIRRTGQPETFPSLDWSQPPSWSRPYILRRFDVDRKKRPLRDMAPCTICSPHHPKCLEGMFLVWYQDEGVVRAIGPECGAELAGGHLLVAEKQAFERRERQRRAESYLEENLPKLEAALETLEALRPGLTEAERLHRKLRSDNSLIPKQFRHIMKKDGGVLSVSVEIKTHRAGTNSTREDDDDRPERIGPRGFGRGDDAVDT
jgi:hypothetical protein